MTENKKMWLTIREFEEEYCMSASAQAKYRMARKIPFSKIGRYIRYNREDIDSWLKAHKVEVA